MRSLLMCAAALALATTAAADPKITIQPTTAKPGDAVLITVTGARELPKGNANKKPLHFFRARTSYQALFAIPLDATPGDLPIDVDQVDDAHVTITTKTFPETDLVVEDELASPDAASRTQIDHDNHIMITALSSHDKDEPAFTHAFRRPPGAVTSTFGEWRTFNDGHRSQHLGLDLFAREGSTVHAINDGTVTLVADTLLAGNVVIVSHGAGIASAYFHLSATTVAEGDEVRAGSELGKAGQTGRTTGPHLHVSIRVPGGFVDPASFFKLRIRPPLPATASR